MNTTIILKYGDCSGDGHNISDSTAIKSNKTVADLQEAYQNGTQIVGFDFKETVAVEYEDSSLTEDQAIALQDAGIDLTEFDDYNEDLDAIKIMDEEFVEVYLKICQLGDPDFLYEYTRMNEINIGGYGLFYC